MATPHREKFKALRLEAGLSRQELADEMGSAYATVYGVETGFNPQSSEDYLAKAARVFSAKLDRKIYWTDLIDRAADEPKPATKPEPRRAPTPRPDVPRPVAPPRPPGPRRDNARQDAAPEAASA